MFYDRPESLSRHSGVIKVHYWNYDSSHPEKTAEIRRSPVRHLDRIVKRTQYPQTIFLLLLHRGFEIC
jgi:hypothetical protein